MPATRGLRAAAGLLSRLTRSSPALREAKRRLVLPRAAFVLVGPEDVGGGELGPRSLRCQASLGSMVIARGSRGPMWAHLGIDGLWIGGLFVNRAFRGIGLGPRIVMQLEQAEPRAKEIFLNVARSNADAVELYRRLGYVERLDLADWSRRINEDYRGRGFVGQELLMSKPLPQRSL